MNLNQEAGIVLRADAGRILVEAEPGNGCACCAAKENCFVRDDKRKRTLWIDNTMGAEPGDRITFYIEERGVVLASVVLYFIPVLFLFVGIITGSFIYMRLGMERDMSAIILGLAGIFLSFIFVRIISPRISRSSVIQPVLTSVEKNHED